MSSVHALRERLIKQRMGIPENSKIQVLNVPSLDNVRGEISSSDEEEQPPRPWEPPLYTSVKDFTDDIPNLLDSLDNGSDDNVEYTSKEALLNLRKLFQNVGELYVAKMMNE